MGKIIRNFFAFIFCVSSTFARPNCPADLEKLALAAQGIHSDLGSLLEALSPVAKTDYYIGFISSTTGRSYFWKYVHAPIEQKRDHPTLKAAIEKASPQTLAFGGLMKVSVTPQGDKFEVRAVEAMRSMTEKLFLRSPPAESDLTIMLADFSTDPKIIIDDSTPVNVLWPSAESPLGRIVTYSGVDFWALASR